MIIIVYLTILDTIIASLVINYLTGKSIKRHYWKYGMFIIIASIFSYVSSSYFDKGIDVLVNVIFFTLLWSFLFKIKLLPVLIGECFTVILINAIEVPAVVLMATSTGETIYKIINNPNLFMFIVGSLCKILGFAIVYFIYRINFKFFDKFDYKDKNESVFSIAIFQVFIFLLVIIMITAKFENVNNTLIVFVLYMFISAFIFAVYLYNQKDKEKIFKLECLNDMQEKTIELVEESITSIRKEKHDFYNHLNTILAICVNNEEIPLAKKIQSYVSNLTHFYINEKIKPESGCEYLDALLVAKYHYAKLHGIKMKFNFEYKLYDYEDKSRDLVGIYGNIIDNAIDAFKSISKADSILDRENTNDNDWYIELESLAISDNLILNFKNNAPPIDVDKISKIFEMNFSTKGDGQKTRGFGLAIVKEIVSHMDGSIYVSSSDDMTLFKVIFGGKATYDQKLGRNLG